MSALDGVRVLVGGPMKALFTARSFDSNMRELVEKTSSLIGDAGAEVFSAHLAEGFGIAELTSAETTARDFQWLLSCDVYVALLPVNGHGIAVPSAGTGIELGWATAFRKPVIILSDHAYGDGYSHLVRGLGVAGSVKHLDIRCTPDELIASISTLTS